jgi:hypothetical protein
LFGWGHVTLRTLITIEEAAEALLSTASLSIAFSGNETSLAPSKSAGSGAATWMKWIVAWSQNDAKKSKLLGLLLRRLRQLALCYQAFQIGPMDA